MFTVSFAQTDKATRPARDANAALIADAPLLLARCRTLEADLVRAVSDRAKLRAACESAAVWFETALISTDPTAFAQGQMALLGLRTALADLDRPTPTG